MFRTPRFHCREQDLISGPAGHGNQPPYPLVHQKAKEKKKKKKPINTSYLCTLHCWVLYVCYIG